MVRRALRRKDSAQNDFQCKISPRTAQNLCNNQNMRIKIIFALGALSLGGILAQEGAPWTDHSDSLAQPKRQFLDADNPKIILDYQNNPIITWAALTPNGREIFVQKRGKNGWEILGSNLNVNPKSQASAPSIILDNSGNPIVAFNELVDHAENIFVKIYKNNVWQELSIGSLNQNTKHTTSEPSIAMTKNNTLFVAWSEEHPNPSSPENTYDIVIKTLKDGKWKLSKISLDETIYYQEFSANLVAIGNKVFLTGRFRGGETPADLRDDVLVFEHTTTSWKKISSSPLNTKFAWNPVISVLNDKPVVAWSERKNDDSQTFKMKKWDGLNWGNMLPSGLNVFSTENGRPLSIDSFSPSKSNLTVFLRYDKLFKLYKVKNETWSEVDTKTLQTSDPGTKWGISAIGSKDGTTWLAWAEAVEGKIKLFVKSANLRD
jgi:hypothetical protein